VIVPAHGVSRPDAHHLGRVSRVAVLVAVTALVVGGLAGAVEARSLLVAGAVLLGWSQLVGL
jgi:hypothetical protein